MPRPATRTAMKQVSRTEMTLTRVVGPIHWNTMDHPMAYAHHDDRSVAEIEAALAAAKEDAERVRAEFVDGLPADSLAYDAEWTTQYGSEDRLIFIFSVVLDLDEKLRMRDYPREAVNQVIADLRRRLVGTRVDAWGVGGNHRPATQAIVR